MSLGNSQTGGWNWRELEGNHGMSNYDPKLETETFNWKSRIQRLGVPCTIWLIRGCLPNTRHGSATASSTQVLVEEGFGCYHPPGAEESIR